MRIKHVIITPALLASLLTGCGSGGQGNSNSNDKSASATTHEKFIPSSSQTITPSSAYTSFKSGNIESLERLTKVNDSCFSIVKQKSGKNYTTTTINSGQYWSTASVNFRVENTCSEAKMINSKILISGLKMNKTNVTSSKLSIGQNGSPWLTTRVSDVSSNVNVMLDSPACSGDYCGWAQVQPHRSRYKCTIIQ